MDAFSLGMNAALIKHAGSSSLNPNLSRALTWMGNNPELAGMIGGGLTGAVMAPDEERRRSYIPVGMAIGAVIGAARRGRTLAGGGARRVGIGGPAAPVGVPGL